MAPRLRTELRPGLREEGTLILGRVSGALFNRAQPRLLSRVLVNRIGGQLIEEMGAIRFRLHVLPRRRIEVAGYLHPLLELICY